MVLPDDRTLGRHSRGRGAEWRALNDLRGAGLKVIERNFRSRFGEIDLIMRDGECIVFVEVRYRTAKGFASAAESVDAHKQRKLARAAMYYISRHPRVANCAMRFDVVAIDDGDITWIRDAFRPDS